MRTGIIIAVALIVASLESVIAQAADAAAPAATTNTGVEYHFADPVSPAPLTTLPLENNAPTQDTAEVTPAEENSTTEAPDLVPRTEKEANKPKKEIEVQFDFLQHRFFNNRHIDNYNLHIYKRWKNIHALSIYGGVTLTGANGYLIDDNQPGVRKNSDAFGIGPSVLLRWEKRITGKLYADLDASGSLRVYGKAHPAGGRAYDFLWRIGPRLTYRYTDDMSISLGYMYAHMSNGFNKHNPGYNGVGFSLGFQHRF